MFLDRSTIYISAGKGGDGCVSLRHEKYVPKGGPDGGDGGDGGSVVLVGDPSLDTLLGFRYSPHFRAADGRPGMGRSMQGVDGAGSEIPVPLGTLIYDADDGTLIALIERPGQRHHIARGGRGGFGNEHFKSATNQTPRQSTAGEPGGKLTLRLELKLIADVGLIGMPNAGKSTMLRAVSRASPKVADYPFTTRSPQLGIAELPGTQSGDQRRRLVVADIPGLIEGASRGAGLGHDFLRHIERTGLLLHLLDIAPADGTEPVDNYHAIQRELAQYSSALAGKPQIIVLNKIDLVGEPKRQAYLGRFKEAVNLAGGHLIAASGMTGLGVEGMLELCWSLLGKDRRPAWRTPT